MGSHKRSDIGANNNMTMGNILKGGSEFGDIGTIGRISSK